jgi:2-oxoglutarate ferredoxin oxidoreductase subunit alpha
MVRAVKRAVDDPEKVVLANRVDGSFITDADIRNILRIVQGRGV